MMYLILILLLLVVYRITPRRTLERERETYNFTLFEEYNAELCRAILRRVRDDMYDEDLLGMMYQLKFHLPNDTHLESEWERILKGFELKVLKLR